jgi:cyanophycin synthetase
LATPQSVTPIGIKTPAALEVTGDGKHSLMQLIQIENYKRMNPRTTALSNIKIDDMVFDYLEKKKMTIEYVPAEAEVVQLRATSNVSKGGNCYDVTDQVHVSIRKFAFDVLKSVHGLPFVGIDLLCADVSQPLHSQDHWICELNASPGLSLHTLPESGERRDTPRAIADVIFGGTQ